MPSLMVPHCHPRHLLLLLAAGLALAGCKNTRITYYRVPKETAPAPAPETAGTPPVAAPQPFANTNDLSPSAARGSTAAPPAEGGLPAGHPALAAAPGAGEMASGAMPTAAGPALVWTAPAAWTPRPGSALRKGSYGISGPEGEADLAIMAFPGTVGGDLANVNRWRDQLGLPPVASLDGAVELIEANGLRLVVFDGANAGRRILGAILPRPGETWFFKLTGPDALVARDKPAFLDFLRTVKAP